MFRLIIALSICLLGCHRVSPQSMWKDDKLRVLTTIAMIEDVVKQVGGPYVTTHTLVHGELDPHSYELVKGDSEKFESADLIFYNGLGLEHALSLRQLLAHSPHAIGVGDYVLQEVPEQILRVEEGFDPHIWMDVSLWAHIVDPIVRALSAKDPMHSEAYHLSGEKTKQALMELDALLFEKLQQVPSEKRYLVTSHDAFHYFGRRYLRAPQEELWSERVAAPEGLAPEAQLSLHEIVDIMEHIQKFQVRVLFPESNVSPRSLKKLLQVGREKGIALELCLDPLYGDAMGSAHTYQEMMEHNVAVIEGALNTWR